MAPTNVCPDRSCLQALLAGELAQKEQEETVRHVETCAACQQTLDSLTPASQSWENLVPHLKKKYPDPAPALRKVIAQAKVGAVTDKTDAEDKSTPHREALPSEETQADPRPGSRDDDLAFLSPPTKAGSIGRLAHYEILAVIGKGGFGTVLKAFDEKLHRMVAIKVLSLELSASGTARQRFIREARAAAAVTHENLVTIHAVEEDHRPPYLVMQLIDGITLQQKIDKIGTVGLKEILRIGSQMAAGLAAAHKQGLVHRDIKPTNVLLENGVERVKITDFGLARAVDDASVTQSGTVAGTPMYMSPEQAEGLPLDHRSDLFSLGTVLYVMCTGRPPFRATGTMAVLKRVTEDTPRPIRETNPEIPEWLADIIAKLHAKKPEERFQTAKDVAELLGQHLADLQQGRAEGRKAPGNAPATVALTPVAHPPNSPPRTPTWYGAASLWFAIGGLVLPLCLVILMSVFLERNDAGLPLALCGILFAIGECVALACGIAGRRSAPGKVGLGLSIISLLLFSLTLGTRLTEPQMAGPVANEELLLLHDRHKDAELENQKDGSWVQLFNGKDLTGWNVGEPLLWKADNGELVSTAKGASIATKKNDYSEFRLRTEVKLDGDSAVGIAFRNKPDEIVLNRSGNTYKVSHESGQRRSVGQQALSELPGSWIHLELIAEMGRIEVSLNGHTMIGKDYFVPIDPQRGGPIVLKAPTTGSAVRFRNIEIKELPIAVAPENPVAYSHGQSIPGWGKVVDPNRDCQFAKSKDELTITVPGGEHDLNPYFRNLAAPRVLRNANGDFDLQVEVPVFNFPKPKASIAGHTNFVAAGLLLWVDDQNHVRFELAADGDSGRSFANLHGFTKGLTVIDEKFNLPNQTIYLKIERRTGTLRFLHSGDGLKWLNIDIPNLKAKFDNPEVKIGVVAVNVTTGTHVATFRGLEIKELLSAEPGWMPLFNGKDLAGWVPVYDQRKYATAPWDIVEPVLVLKGGKDQPTGYLRTEKQYRLFHLRFDFKHTPFAPQQIQKNSGILWGIAGTDDPSVESQATGGLELALNKLLQPGGTVYWPKGLNQNLPWTNVRGEEVPENKWNRCEIFSKATELELRINGVSKIIKDYQAVPGHIALLSRQQGLHLRNIEIKELPFVAAFFHGQAIPDWGEVVDPNRDCQFAKSKDELTITVSAGHHNLNPAAPFSNVAAPRVLRKASGDFDLQVSVPPFNRPGPNTASGSPNSYVGAGLLCWQDSNNFVRFFRAANGESGRLIASLEIFTEGKKLLWEDVDVPDSATFLRAERRAGYFHFTHSADGVKWSEITVPRQKYLADALELGVAATNSTTKTHVATFRKLEIKELASAYKDDKDRLQGQWLVESFEPFKGDPKIIPRNALRGITFTGNNFHQDRLPKEGDPAKGTFKLDETANPRQIEFFDPEYGSFFGIYRFDGDRLVMCYGEKPGRDGRPTDFKVSKGSVIVFIRATKPEESGWVQLFNAKDLTGWKTHLEQPGYWHVENGVLLGSGKRSHLFSERGDFKNFHLRVEAKLNKGGNSGVLFRSEYGLGFDQKLVGGAGKLPLGYEVDLHTEADQPNPTGSVWRLGMRSGKPAAWDWKASSPNIQPDAWVTLEVIAEGNRIKTRVNGNTVLETADDTDLFHMGHLALQVEKEGTVVHFRKIEIKELPAPP
jgi:uncharacterized protein (TIGR03067 family)